MSLFKKFIVAIILAGALGYIISIFLPSRWEIQRSLEIKASKSEIYRQLEDLNNWLNWYPWTNKSDITLRHEISQPSRGIGATMKWQGQMTKPGKVVITQSDPQQGVWYNLTLNESMEVQGSILMSETENGILVTWQDQGSLEHSFISRLLVSTLDEMVGADFEKGLQALKQLVEK